MKFFGSTQKINRQNEKWEKFVKSRNIWSSFSPTDLAYNQYQERWVVLWTFTTNESKVYMLNVEPSNLVRLKTYNSEFDEINHNIYGSRW